MTGSVEDTGGGRDKRATATDYDAVVVGSGPNGLASAITLAEAGQRVLVIEGRETVGGGMRSAELTLPGFVHDICSAVHPLSVASPFFRQLNLAPYGLEWIHPTAPLAHPFEDGLAAVLCRSLEETGETLGEDANAYRQLMGPLLDRWVEIVDSFLGPLRLPGHPLVMARFGWHALRPASGLAQRQFQGRRARAFFAGLAAHGIMPLGKLATAGFGLMLGLLGHAVGWPMPRGGAQQLADALASYFVDQGGEIVTGRPVTALAELPSARMVLLDVTPRQLLRLASDELPPNYRRQLAAYRYGPGVCKVDWALSEPIPWTAPRCRDAGTIHVGGTLVEIAASERAAWEGRIPERPFVLLVQHTLFDPSRAPEGQHTAWGYCHVPNGANVDVTTAIEKQIERFAPGFRDCVLERHTMTAVEMENYNPNYVGGDINGGVQDLGQLFTRPVPRLNPYSTPLDGVYLCSSSTPPGGGVHGMSGYYAARAALRELS